MPVQKELPQNQLNNIIRMVLKADQERALAIRQATFDTLKRLRVPRDLSKATTKTPNGSDQCDIGSIITWLNKVEKIDSVAITQIVLIDATAVARTS